MTENEIKSFLEEHHGKAVLYKNNYDQNPEWETGVAGDGIRGPLIRRDEDGLYDWWYNMLEVMLDLPQNESK